VAVNKHYEAELFIKQLGNNVAKVALEAHGKLAEQGCTSYVKTIYIGYEINGEMVAALYGHAKYVEVALALDESTDSSVLIDATHLTWRTLPFAAVVKTKEDLEKFGLLAITACENIRNGRHKVNRDNQFFAAAKRERRF
jgi:hypothetical protein